MAAEVSQTPHFEPDDSELLPPQELEDSHALRTRLFFQSFCGGSPTEGLAELLGNGTIQALIPESGDNWKLVQDERWHGEDPVGESILRGPAIMRALIRHDLAGSDIAPELTPEATAAELRDVLGFELPEGSPPLFRHKAASKLRIQQLYLPPLRFRTLLLLSAFFADMGKNDDPALGENRGRFKKKDDGEGFRVVQFTGHEQRSAEIFSDRFGIINQFLPVKLQLSLAEMALCEMWIEFSGRGNQFARSENAGPTDSCAERILSYVASSKAVTDHHVLFEQALCGLLLVQKVQICLSAPQGIRSKTSEKSWDQWSLRWNYTWSRFSEIIAHSLDVTRIAAHRAALSNRFYVPLLGGRDWEELAIQPQRRGELQRRVRNAWELDEIKTRLDALRFAVKHCNLEVSDAQLLALAQKSGGYKLFSGKLEQIRQVSQDHKCTPDGDYTVARWEAEPVRQFTVLNRLEAVHWLQSGNFPNVQKWVDGHESSTKGKLALTQLLAEGPFTSMLQLEAFLATEDDDPLDVATGHAPNMTMMAITRADNNRRLIVPFGYQGVADHVGVGVLHFNHERSDALQRNFKRDHESHQEMLDRFLFDVVAHIGGTHRVSFPSHISDDRYLIPGRANGSPDCYATLVIDRSSLEERIMTVIFHGERRKLLRDLKYYNRKLVDQKKPGFSVDQVLEKVTAERV